MTTVSQVPTLGRLAVGFQSAGGWLEVGLRLYCSCLEKFQKIQIQDF